MNPLALLTTARKALVTAISVATAIEATGVITGAANTYLLTGIAVAGAVLTGTATYAIGNTDPKKAATTAETINAQTALMDQFNNGGGSNAV